MYIVKSRENNKKIKKCEKYIKRDKIASCKMLNQNQKGRKQRKKGKQITNAINGKLL